MAQNTSRTENLYGLYYPETICLNEIDLKYFLLIYDKIFFLPTDIQLNPGHTALSKRFSINDAILTGAYQSRREAHYALMYCSDPRIWDDRMKRLMHFYDECEDQQLFVALHDPDFESPNKVHPLRMAVDSDMADADFVFECLRRRNKKIFIPRTDEATIKGGGFATRPGIYKDNQAIPGICSERINSALYFAEREELFPVTGNDMYPLLLSHKLKRIADVRNGLDLGATDRHSFSILSWELVTEVVPRTVIQDRTPREVLKYKEACTDLKLRFRQYLWSLEAAVATEPWDPKFSHELNMIITGKVLPEVQKIRDRKTEIWEKLFGDTLKSLTSLKVAPPLLGLQLIPGLTFWEILSFSTAVIGVSTLPQLLDAWKDEKQRRRNALFFLLRFAKR